MNTLLKKKVAVIGTGSIGTMHLNVLKLLGIQVIAVPQRSDRKEILKKQGFSVALDIHEAVEQGAKFFIVATDTAQHVDDGLKILEYDCALLIEKPLAPDIFSVEKIYERIKKARQRVFVGCVLRFSESLNIFKKLLQKIGTVYSVRIECRSYLPDWRKERSYQQSYSAKTGEGGVLRDLIHEIDYAGWLFGWPKSLQANLRNFGILNIDVEEMAELGWETNAGASVSLCLDYLSRIPRRKMTAFGADGVLEWDGLPGKVMLELTNEPIQIFATQQSREEMFLKQMEAFLASHQQDTDYKLATAEEGVKALAVCDAARIASQNRKLTTINYL